MSDLWSNPLFGLALSILAYLFRPIDFRKFPHPLTTPLLIAAVLVIAFEINRYFLQGLLCRRLPI